MSGLAYSGPRINPISLNPKSDPIPLNPTHFSASLSPLPAPLSSLLPFALHLLPQSRSMAPSSLELILRPCFKSFLSPAPACWLHPYTGTLISTSTIPLAPSSTVHQSVGRNLSFRDETSTIVEAPPGSPSPLSVIPQCLSFFALKFISQGDTAEPSSSLGGIYFILSSTFPCAPDLGNIIGFLLKLHSHFQKTGPHSSL